jgi:hypothetical protein
LICAHGVARESGAGDKSRLEWTLQNKTAARDVKDRFGFNEVDRDGKGYHLAREIDYRLTL